MTLTHTHNDNLIHWLAFALILSILYAPTHSYTHTLILSHSLTLTLSYTHPIILLYPRYSLHSINLSYSHSLSYSLTHSLSLSLLTSSITQTHTHYLLTFLLIDSYGDSLTHTHSPSPECSKAIAAASGMSASPPLTKLLLQLAQILPSKSGQLLTFRV